MVSDTLELAVSIMDAINEGRIEPQILANEQGRRYAAYLLRSRSLLKSQEYEHWREMLTKGHCENPLGSEEDADEDSEGEEFYL